MSYQRVTLGSPTKVSVLNVTRALAGATPANDATLALTHTNPAGTAVTVANGSLTNDATGIYSYVLTFNVVGLWHLKWAGANMVSEDTVEVFSVLETI